MRWFKRYTAALAVAAAATAAAVAPVDSDVSDHVFTYVLLAAALLAGELLPVGVPRRGSTEQVTMSSAFALAILLTFGPGPAIAAYVAASLISDLAARVAPLKLVFNAAHYTVSLGAAAAVLALAGNLPPGPVADHLPAAIGAVAAFFVVDNVVPAIGTALLRHERLVASVSEDAWFHLWTAGAPVVLAPVIAAAAEASPWLIPLMLIPAAAFWAGGRKAIEYARRSLYDTLTGLPNRSLLLMELGDRLGPRSSATVAIVDIVDFTAVNDAFGHSRGDAVLREIATRLQNSVPPDYLVARMSGDDFAIACIGNGGASDEINAAVETALAEPFHIGELSLEVRTRSGVASYPRDASHLPAVIARASAALQRAKARHTACEHHDAELEDASLDRLVLAGQLRRGIERHELEVHYQPKLATRPGGQNGVEALVRWRHPDLGLVPPDGFVPLAERVGLIDMLTAFVVERALEQCAEWRAGGLELRVAVNLSSRNLLDPELPARVANALSSNLVPPRLLQLELTESTMVNDLPLAREALEALRRIGVRIAIDDFGTGHSSLTQLRKLPVDEIKIDKSFVMGMEHDTDDEAIVRSTVALGRTLGREVTAEGVESADVCATLGRLGCDYVQGYHLSPPLPAASCRAAVERCLADGVALAEGRLFARPAADDATGSRPLPKGTAR